MMTVAKAELTEEEEEINVDEEEEEEVEEGLRMAEDLRVGSSSLPQTSDNFGLAASQRRKQRR